MHKSYKYDFNVVLGRQWSRKCCWVSIENKWSKAPMHRQSWNTNANTDVSCLSVSQKAVQIFLIWTPLQQLSSRTVVEKTLRRPKDGDLYQAQTGLKVAMILTSPESIAQSTKTAAWPLTRRLKKGNLKSAANYGKHGQNQLAVGSADAL